MAGESMVAHILIHKVYVGVLQTNGPGLAAKLSHRDPDCSFTVATCRGKSPKCTHRGRAAYVGGYYCKCFVLSLRSSEGLMADLEGLLMTWSIQEAMQIRMTLLRRYHYCALTDSCYCVPIMR